MYLSQIAISTWAQFAALFPDERHAWVFRGQSEAGWFLQTSLERSLPAHDKKYERQYEFERSTIASFKRRAHHFVQNPPSPDDTLEWSALLRHHGGPSRLLDVSRSPYAAAYFAVAGSNPKLDFAVWAFLFPALQLKTAKALERVRGPFVTPEQLADTSSLAILALNSKGPSDVRGVVLGEPQRMNERMAAQQGTFLAPLDLGVSFEQNLASLFGGSDLDWGKASSIRDRDTEILKIIFPAAMRRSVMAELKAMNISAATLYPGLDGFVRSLKEEMEFG